MAHDDFLEGRWARKLEAKYIFCTWVLAEERLAMWMECSENEDVTKLKLVEKHQHSYKIAWYWEGNEVPLAWCLVKFSMISDFKVEVSVILCCAIFYFEDLSYMIKTQPIILKPNTYTFWFYGKKVTVQPLEGDIPTISKANNSNDLLLASQSGKEAKNQELCMHGRLN